MRFEIAIPPPESESSSRLQTPKPKPPPAAAGTARPATMIAKRPRGRPPRKVISNQDKLNAIARHLHAEYRWSLKDVIRHMVVDEPGEQEYTAKATSAITTTTQQQQQERVGALIGAIWGQPEVLSEIEAHPKFPASLGRRQENSNTGEGVVSDNGSADEEEENQEGDEMSLDSGREAGIEDDNEGDTSVEASAEAENEGETYVEASAANEKEGEISVDANVEDENKEDICMDASAEDQNGGGISVDASAEGEYEREEISASTQDVVSAEEENPPTSGHSYTTQEEEEESSEDSTSPPQTRSHLPLHPPKPTNSPPTIATNPTDSISSANILRSPHRTRGKKIDYISLALALPPDPDDDDENDGDFALSHVSTDR